MDESVEQRKAASAAGAADNSGVGVDGDDPSVADTEHADGATTDPVTGSGDHATGEDRAAENADRDPAG